MSQNRLEPQLVMKRPNLNGLEPVVIPKGYSLRPFLEGDESAWEKIILESFESPYDFSKSMKTDPAFQPERILLITCNDIPVATASAWYREEYGPDWGYIHMVGVLPSHQGKKLGYWVNLAALHHFVIEQRRGAILQTDDYRLAAIKTYIKLGFEPYLIHENQRDRWKNIFIAFSDAESYLVRFEKHLSRNLDAPDKDDTTV